MDQWWDDFDRAFEAAYLLDPTDDTEMMVGTALLVFHTIGKAAFDSAAHSLNPMDGFLDAAESISQSKLIGPICKAFDDASGIEGYGAARVAGIKRQADEGARSLASSLRQDHVPWPLVCKRVGETYGLPVPSVVPIRKAMGNGHDLITGLAADRALLRWAATISKAEATFSKAEKDTFAVKGKQRTVHRDPETGEFVSPGEGGEAKPDKREQMRQRKIAFQRTRNAKMREQTRSRGEEREKEKVEEKAQEQELTPEQIQDAEEEAERIERQERLARKRRKAGRADIAQREHVQELMAQQAAIEERAKTGYLQAKERSRTIAAERQAEQDRIANRTRQAEAVPEQEKEAVQEQVAEQAKTKVREKAKEQVQEEVRQEEAPPTIDLFRTNNPSGTARIQEMTLGFGDQFYRLKVPTLFKGWQSLSDMGNDTNQIVGLYTGNHPLDVPALYRANPDFLAEQMDHTLRWQEIINLKNAVKNKNELDFLSSNLGIPSSPEQKERMDVARKALNKFVEARATTLRKDPIWTEEFSGNAGDLQGFIGNVYDEVLKDTFMILRPNTMMNVLQQWSEPDEKPVIDGLIRAMQIKELTSAYGNPYDPDKSHFANSDPFIIGHTDLDLDVLMYTKTGVVPKTLTLKSNEMSRWKDQLHEYLMSDEVFPATMGGKFRLVVEPPKKQHPDKPPVVSRLHNRDMSFNASGIMEVKIAGDTPVLPIAPHSMKLPVLSARMMEYRNRLLQSQEYNPISKLVRELHSAAPTTKERPARIGEPGSGHL